MLEEICAALDSLAESIKKHTDDRTYQEMYGWNCAPLTAKDLAVMPKNLALTAVWVENYALGLNNH
jgi:hypothetical protein